MGLNNPLYKFMVRILFGGSFKDFINRHMKFTYYMLPFLSLLFLISGGDIIFRGSSLTIYGTKLDGVDRIYGGIIILCLGCASSIIFYLMRCHYKTINDESRILTKLLGNVKNNKLLWLIMFSIGILAFVSYWYFLNQKFKSYY